VAPLRERALAVVGVAGCWTNGLETLRQSLEAESTGVEDDAVLFDLQKRLLKDWFDRLRCSSPQWQVWKVEAVWN
jgi:hypothetical protein